MQECEGDKEILMFFADTQHRLVAKKYPQCPCLGDCGYSCLLLSLSVAVEEDIKGNHYDCQGNP